MWSGITIIPVIEPALRIIMNVGLLISNRYQYHCKKRDFDPDLSFTKQDSYFSAERIVVWLKRDFATKQLDIAQNVHDSAKQGNLKDLTFRLKNSEITYTVNQEQFKLSSGTYRKLSTDFLTREGVCYPHELKEFKDTTIPDSFSEVNFNRWTGYITCDLYDKDDLNQVKEFVFPRCFSEESVGLLNDYFIRGKKALKHLDKNSLLEFFKLADYLEMPALEGYCVIPFLENIHKNGQSELSETELKEIENSAIIAAYTEQIKSLCAEIKKCKDKYNTSGFPEELADLDSKMNKMIKKIIGDFFVLLYLGILPLYPLLSQTVSPLTWLLLQSNSSAAHLVGLRYLFDIWKMLAMWLNICFLPIVLSVLSDKPIPKTTAIFKKIAYAIYTIAKHILYAPIFVGKETGKAILFTAIPAGTLANEVPRIKKEPSCEGLEDHFADCGKFNIKSSQKYTKTISLTDFNLEVYNPAGIAVLFTAKTLSKIPYIIHSRFKPLIS